MASRTEARCLRRGDLLETLAKELPSGSIRFGCHVEAISLEPITRSPVISTRDGTTIKAKLLIGCDGSNSVVAKFLGLKPVEFLPMWSTRGFTICPEGHEYGNHFLRITGDGVDFKVIPVDEKTVYFNAIQFQPSKLTDFISVHQGYAKSKDKRLIQQVTLQAMQELPEKMIDLVRRCDIASLSFTQLSYRHPWHMVLEVFQEGTVTIAGDAMHPMGPFLGQGGSSSLEDAVVLAQCLDKTMFEEGVNSTGDDWKPGRSVEEGLRLYVKERRWRILMLCVLAFLSRMRMVSPSRFKRVSILSVLTYSIRSKILDI
ncbi:hypothetical protein ACP70R_029172 [Stipagrostis hirtigluma subsp. patula]